MNYLSLDLLFMLFLLLMLLLLLVEVVVVVVVHRALRTTTFCDTGTTVAPFSSSIRLSLSLSLCWSASIIARS